MHTKIQYFFIIFYAFFAVATADALYDYTYSLIRDFPHQASICGISAVIISKNWVLTADRLDEPWLDIYPTKYVVRAGAFFSRYDDEFDPSVPGSFHHVDKVINYEEKNRTSKHKGPAPFSRIILMRVREPFEFDESRKPIKLSKPGEKLVPGTIANVSGFGVFTEYTLYLQSMKVPMMDRDLCNKTYQVDIHLAENLGERIGIPEGYICADYTENTKFDESDYLYNSYYNRGGSVTVGDRLVGIFGHKYSNKIFAQNPKLFIDVAYYREWIQQHIDQPLL